MTGVADILSYEGSAGDVAVNYPLLALTSLAVYAAQRDRPRRGPWWLAVWLFLFCFQIALCLVEGCSGVSVVWCALAGYSAGEWRRELADGWLTDRLVRQLRALSFALCGAAVVYYAAVADALTTVAHACALLLGLLLERLVAWADPPPRTRGPASGPPSDPAAAGREGLREGQGYTPVQ